MTPLLHEADGVYLGAEQADRVYLGEQQVWPYVSPYVAAVLADNPWVWLRFAETGLTALDSSEYSGHATGTLTADKRTTDSPVDGAAALFDGSNWITLNGSWHPTPARPFPLTWELWWKATSPPIGAFSQALLDYSWAEGSARDGLAVHHYDSGAVQVECTSGAGTLFLLSLGTSGITTIPLNVWTHLVLTYDHGVSNYWRLYLNGVQVVSEQKAFGASSVWRSTGAFSIGRRTKGTFEAAAEEKRLRGAIDELAIYPHVLPAARVAAHYAARAA